MEKALTGLFGSGPEAEAKTDRARDFVKRYSEGAPDEGYTADEAKGQLNDLLRHANSDQVERATRSALNKLPENQRSEFGDFVSQLQTRKSGGSRGTASVDEISKMFGQAGGSANSLDDLFGSLMGGGAGGTTAAGGGILAMIMNLLGSLFGGKTRARATTGATAGGADLGSLFASGAGKAVMGGLTAYLTKELLDNR